MGIGWAFMDIWKSCISHIFKDVEIGKRGKNQPITYHQRYTKVVDV